METYVACVAWRGMLACVAGVTVQAVTSRVQVPRPNVPRHDMPRHAVQAAPCGVHARSVRYCAVPCSASQAALPACAAPRTCRAMP